MDERQLARFFAAGRVCMGTLLCVLPATVGRRWLGPVGSEAGTKIAVRAVGIRDIVLGLGVFRALDRGEPVSPWIRAGAAVDAVDVAAAALASRRIGLRHVLPEVALAGTSALVHLRIADHVD